MLGSATLAAPLLLAGAVHALPELSIAKRGDEGDVSGNLPRRGLVKRQGTVETNVYDILTYSTGGAYYANGESYDAGGGGGGGRCGEDRDCLTSP